MKHSKDRVQLEGIAMRPVCALMSTRVRARRKTIFPYARVLPLVVILAVSLASCAQNTTEAPVAQAEPTAEQPAATIAPPTPTIPAPILTVTSKAEPTAEPPTATVAPPTPTIPAPTLTATSKPEPTAEPPTPTIAPPTPTMPAPDLTVTRIGADCILDAPPSIVAAEQVTVLLVNQTDEPVQFDMWRVGEGNSWEDLAKAIDLAKMRAEAGAAPSPHPAYLSDLTTASAGSGNSTTMERSVQPGTYAIVCLRRYREANMEMRPFALAGPIEVSE